MPPINFWKVSAEFMCLYGSTLLSTVLFYPTAESRRGRTGAEKLYAKFPKYFVPGITLPA